jgi:hypothetical protein
MNLVLLIQLLAKPSSLPKCITPVKMTHRLNKEWVGAK